MTIKSTTVSVLKSYRLHSILYIIMHARISVEFAVCAVCLNNVCICVYVLYVCTCMCVYMLHVCIVVCVCVYVCMCVCVSV